ncbi:phospholipase A [Roseateles amylovorans]|uniref:Phospholipase A1 n=1 Tax=Roseateles amylovorans TaxID=2978473 RepID=A0ABY6B568_9BURK|nr:phospholipase A [Roseateles amylovorans]UXH78693.1 phospholipase A [Roseateles amylovorans]
MTLLTRHSPAAAVGARPLLSSLFLPTLPTLPLCGAALALVSVLGLPSAARAQSSILPPGGPGDCTRIDDPAARLSCYDRMHSRPADPAPPASTSAARPAVPTDGTARRLTAAPVPAAAASAPEDPCSRLPEAAGSARSYLGSTLSERWELTCRDQLPAFLPRPYKPVYLLPVSWTSRANRDPRGSESPDNGVVNALDLDKNEAKFQVSLKSKIWSMDDFGTFAVWGAYTQSSRWQVYNGRSSRPFRETNYEPEVILTHGMDVGLPFGWKARMASVSFNHQSNGRAQPLSRSWNRVIGELNLERGETTVSLRPWWRIEDGTDDNPGIKDYMGRGELLVTQKWGQHVVTLQGRHSLRSGDRSRGSAQLEWAFPIGAGLHGYAQLFHGYGESLIDYNFRETRIGLGVSVIEWR